MTLISNTMKQLHELIDTPQFKLFDEMIYNARVHRLDVDTILMNTKDFIDLFGGMRNVYYMGYAIRESGIQAQGKYQMVKYEVFQVTMLMIQLQNLYYAVTGEELTITL
jgi:hypothetical protein